MVERRTPAVRNRHADLLGETSGGGLVHIELQSSNDAHMAVRMLEYSIAIRRKLHRFPEQIVLYVGNGRLRMKNSLAAPGLAFEYRQVDVREIDGESLLNSGVLEDNVMAVLARLNNEREAVRRILTRIAAENPGERSMALAELMILAGLRKLGEIVEGEIEQMPILDDIMDHAVIGRERRRGMALGREEGRAEGERLVILRLIAKRFGQVPDWARQRLESSSASDLEQIELRLLDAATLEELLG